MNILVNGAVTGFTAISHSNSVVPCSTTAVITLEPNVDYTITAQVRNYANNGINVIVYGPSFITYETLKQISV